MRGVANNPKFDLRKREGAEKRDKLGINLSVSRKHYEKLQHRRNVLGIQMSTTVRKALDYYFDDIENREIEKYLKEKLEMDGK